MTDDEASDLLDFLALQDDPDDERAATGYHL